MQPKSGLSDLGLSRYGSKCIILPRRNVEIEISGEAYDFLRGLPV